MPKMKTTSGAKKRFKLTGTGQIKRQKANRSHILTSKNRKRKRNLRNDTLVDASNMRLVKHCLALG
ncbi:MAG: 50S ribosomal protein L35 ['Candidatus Kapabacteria' thiocyanatum]|uniref:Large ribosomal subunit protein bL35 n=1 Tax=Candidatus Kapaibacterium thiocyanatum TaxID=1895771 RepID=A0A1M3L144_9BACT|nr:50S ribosomal protein L35 ['Candidatus Kapabacteria' thiocyanatum]OJX58653.1 MAG: 50S ribosomal protein L35 ['Candidatus Kapabacteria' thiocyanatum]